MKKLIVCISLISTLLSSAQDSTSNQKADKSARREEKQDRISAMIKQEEEGVLAYKKQTALGLQLRTNGYGFFFEKGKTRSPRKTNLYVFEVNEIKHPKEYKEQQANGVFANSYIYGKINNFYPVKLGFGQQYILGQKGNKNGIAVMAIYQGGLSLGLLRPYYLRVAENNKERDIKYNSPDSTLFLDPSVIIGSSGLSKGWNEIKLKPGAFIKSAMRFDFGRYNETVQAIEIGLSLEGYASKIEIMTPRTGDGFDAVKANNLFFQGHIAFLFGRRK